MSDWLTEALKTAVELDRRLLDLHCRVGLGAVTFREVARRVVEARTRAVDLQLQIRQQQLKWLPAADVWDDGEWVPTLPAPVSLDAGGPGAGDES